MTDAYSTAVVFRPEVPGDAAGVRAVVEEAVAAHGRISGELVDRLRRSPDWIDGLSFVAAEHDVIVGHVLFSRGLLDAPRRLVDVLVGVSRGWGGPKRWMRDRSPRENRGSVTPDLCAQIGIVEPSQHCGKAAKSS